MKWFGTRALARATAGILMAALLSAPAWAQPGGGVHGRLLGLDGRPAAGHVVVLQNDAGRTHARATTDSAGRYVFQEVPAGLYGLSIENPEGKRAPVLGEPARVGSGATVRRDVRLMQARPESAPAPAGSSGWWSGMGATGKTWVVVGTVAMVGFAAASLDDDEERASPQN